VQNGEVQPAVQSLLVPETFAEARAQFPVLEKIAYLNAGTFGPLATTTVEAVRSELERDFADGRSGTPYFRRVMDLREQVRARLAAFVAVDPLHVTLTSSTTDGCNIVLAGLGLGRDDEILTTTAEHFGLLGALSASGARVVTVEPEPDAIRAAITPRTRLLALSQVTWTTGRVLPVRELRAEIGIPVLVDAAQSVGAIPVDASGLDFLTISGQKWLCGPDSAGALVVAEPERLRITAPSYFSQARHETDGRFEPRPGAARFDGNWWPASALAGLIAALETRPAWGFDHAAAVAERCRSLLASRVDVVLPGEHERSTLVAFRAPQEPAELVEALYEEGVHVREIPGTGLIRVSCGWWTSDGDLDRLLAALPA
jgi:L-cysteine/cystine lyase